MEQVIFHSPISGNWDKLDNESLEFIERQAKERHLSTLSESESITNKTITVLIGLFAFMGYITSFKLIKFQLPQNETIKYFILLWGLFIVGLFIHTTKAAVGLLFPKGIKQGGLPPSVTIPNNIISVDQSLRYKFLVYNRIKIYEDDINYMQEQNKQRAIKYKKLLENALFIFIASLIAVSVLISHL